MTKTSQIKFCSFCGKGTEEVAVLVAGPVGFICNECVEICNEVIADRDLTEADARRRMRRALEQVRATFDEFVPLAARDPKVAAVAMAKMNKTAGVGLGLIPEEPDLRELLKAVAEVRGCFEALSGAPPVGQQLALEALNLAGKALHRIEEFANRPAEEAVQ